MCFKQVNLPGRFKFAIFSKFETTIIWTSVVLPIKRYKCELTDRSVWTPVGVLVFISFENYTMSSVGISNSGIILRFLHVVLLKNKAKTFWHTYRLSLENSGQHFEKIKHSEPNWNWGLKFLLITAGGSFLCEWKSRVLLKN